MPQFQQPKYKDFNRLVSFLLFCLFKVLSRNGIIQIHRPLRHLVHIEINSSGGIKLELRYRVDWIGAGIFGSIFINKLTNDTLTY